MKKYDIVVIGSGSGASVVDEAVAHGAKVALVDRGPLGGTCLNLGCIPSKMLIYPADVIVGIQEASKLGIGAEVKSIDFPGIMERMRASRAHDREHIREQISGQDGADFYEAEGHFVQDYTLEVGGEQVKGDRIVIAAGSRPLIPPIKGLDSVEYLTNETLLELREKPESLIIIGGGYVAVEYAHFFAAMGTRVTILEMADRLVLSEEPEIAEVLKNALGKRMQVFTNMQAREVTRDGQGVRVEAASAATGETKAFTAQKLLVAVGRRSNADLLKLENTGVQTDQKGFIKVNDYLETTKKHIYAIGDVIGRQMFTHAANAEAAVVANNILHDHKVKMDFSVVPHAVFSHPQIASVGLGEEEARRTHKVVIGRARYQDVAKGVTMMEEEGFAKAVLEKDSRKILGLHIVGPYAPELIQEAVNAMNSGGHSNEIAQGLHIHPALSELMPTALAQVEE